MNATGQWPDAGLVRLAAYMKHLLSADADAIPKELRTEARLFRVLEAQAGNPAGWRNLPPDRLQLLVYQRLLRYAYTNDVTEAPTLIQLYRLALDRLDVRARLQLEADVANVLDSENHQLIALMLFMVHDPDLAVASTASLDLVTLKPLRDDDPMTGAKSAYDLAAVWVEHNDSIAAGILAGILLLGDWRTLPILDGCWQALGPVAQRRLTQARSGTVYASVVEFYLRWLEAVDEVDFGFPAGALGALAADGVGHATVRDVERRFPAPFNLPPEEYQRNPPITLIQEWTIDEYARIIEPRLRMLYLRETYDKVMPRVLDAWGLEVGLETEEDQYGRVLTKFEADVVALRRLADGIAENTMGETADERARRGIASMFTDECPPPALATEMGLAKGGLRIADERRDQAAREEDPTERERLLQGAQAIADVSDATLRHLRQQFGPDLETAARDMTRVWQRMRPDAVQAKWLQSEDQALPRAAEMKGPKAREQPEERPFRLPEPKYEGIPVWIEPSEGETFEQRRQRLADNNRAATMRWTAAPGRGQVVPKQFYQAFISLAAHPRFDPWDIESLLTMLDSIANKAPEGAGLPDFRAAERYLRAHQPQYLNGLRVGFDPETSASEPDPSAMEAALRQAQAKMASRPEGQPPDARARELMEPLARLAGDIPADATGLTPDEQARKLLASHFNNPPSPGVALNAASAVMLTSAAKAQRLKAEAAADRDAAARGCLLAEADDAEKVGDAIAHHLRQHFGSDLERMAELWER